MRIENQSKILLFGLVLMLFSFSGNSQILESTIFQHLGKIDGLENSYNDFLSKDSRGFLWISSINGIYRYDGLELKLYANDSQNDSLLLGDIVLSAFYEDKRGDLWFSTDAGINRYIRSKDSIEYFQIKDENNKPIAIGYYLFYLQRDNLLWFQANDAIYKYHIEKGTSEKIVETKGVRFAVDTLKNGEISKIYSCLWMLGSGLEIISIFNDKPPQKKHYLNDKATTNTVVGPIQVSNVIKGNGNQIWLISDKGLLNFNPLNPSSTKIYTFLNKVEERLFVSGTKLNSDNLLLVGQNSGLQIFDIKNTQFLRHELNNLLPFGISSNQVRTVHKDEEENLWLVQRNTAEIDYAWANQNQFFNPFQGHIEISPTVTALVEDLNQNIWCATQNFGIYVFNKNRNLLYHFDENRGGLNIKEIKQLSIDRKGKIWAIGEHKLLQFNSSRNYWEEKIDEKDKQLFFVHHLSPNQKIVSTNKSITEFKINKEDELQATKRKIVKDDQYSLVHFYEKNNGLLYVFSPFGPKELRIYRRDTDSLALVKVFSTKASINTIWEDVQQKVIWLGTNNGLFQLDRIALDSIKPIRGDFNIYPQQIFEIQGDSKRRLWITASDGLWCYSSDANRFFRFGLEDGLPSDKFSLNASIFSSDEKLWLGTDKGLVVFAPNKIQPNPFGPHIFIKSLEINNAPFVTDTVISELKELKLDYRQNKLRFELVAISHYYAKRNIINYRLKGYEEEWRILENGEQAVFNKVPPGNYMLEVFGLNANGVEGKVRRLEIIISKPIWNLWWFWSLIGLGIGAIFALVIWMRLKQKLRKQQVIFEKQQVLQEERDRIAKDLHDELGSGLSNIRFMSEAMRGKLKDNEEEERLGKIYNSSVFLIDRMQDIIWTMNKENGSMEDLLFFLRREAFEYLDNNQIDCYFDIPEEIPSIELTGEQRKNILLTLKEALHNIVKHAGANLVKIVMKIDQELEVNIHDNGSGFVLQESIYRGNGLRNMRERIQSLQGVFTIISSKQGTIVRFTVPLPVTDM